MKKFFSVLSIFFCILLCSCASSSHEDTYFIHALSFDKQNNEYHITALCEKSGEKDSKYFTISESGKNFREATKKIKNNYKECYFATNRYYFFNINSDKQLLYDFAHEICDSNTYPTKSSCGFFSGLSANDFLNCIKNEDSLKKISLLTDKKETNVIKFLSFYTTGREIEIPTFSADSNEKITLCKNTKFNKK